jgi:hypothetical protein
MPLLEDRLVTTLAEAGHEPVVVDIAINLGDDRRRRSRLPRSCAVRRFRRLFNALNYLDRRGGDSTDWAD